MIKRILVIGCCGAGKSTLSGALSEKTGLPVIHLDALFWKDNWTESTREEMDAAIMSAAQADAWIMDGNYSRTLPMRLAFCDCVIFLDYPRYVCMWGVFKRILKFYGKCRPDMGKNCPERLDFQFLKYVWNFEKKQKPKLLSYLDDAKVPIFTIKSRKECYSFMEKFPF